MPDEATTETPPNTGTDNGKDTRDSPERSSRKSSGGSSTTSKITSTEGAGTVVALMGVTVLFALIGEEVKKLQGQQTPGSNVVTVGGKIIIGGVIATSLLVLLTHAGNGGRQFAVGLALVATATTTLVYGKPVWDAMNNAFGSKPTSGTTGVTGNTTGGLGGVSGPNPAPVGGPYPGQLGSNPYLFSS